MKKLLSLVLLAILCAGTVQACKKKVADKVSMQMPNGQETVIIVMDTTQALLQGVEVQLGSQKLLTSWDGRIVLKNGLPTDVAVMKLECKGYEPLSVSIKELAKQSRPIILAMTRKYAASEDGGSKVYASRGGALTKSKGEHLTGAARYDVMEAYVEEMPAVDGKAEYAPGHRPTIDAPVNNVQAGKLTAGEVNDFAKWYFWTKVINDTHKKYLSNWKIEARNRYTVQVTNKEGYPIVAEPVSLIDAKGNTLFQAVTDNTGKAELWANLLSGQQQTGNLQIRVDEQVQEAKPWSKGLNTFVIDAECGASDAVDVVFVFDATGSMGDELRYLQAEMRDVIARAKDATGGLAIRTGAVVYRDHGDEYVTRLSRLTDDIKTTQTFIDKQRASGGGDFPEAIPEALMAAINTAGWNQEARARIAFLVLDAPCHKDSTTIALLHEQVLNAAAWGIRVVPVVCSGLDEAGELLMRSIALTTNGTSFFLTDDSGIGNTHLKPTTDTLKVEHLNDMLVRTIVEFSTIPACDEAQLDDAQVDEHFIPNPFDAKDLANLEAIPHGPTTIYLLDITGKLIAILNGDISTIEVSKATYPLSTGIYFLKAYIDDRWVTKKILVR